MIVVLIVAIAAGLAVPMLGQTDATRLRAAAQLLVADLEFAQIESIAHGDDLRVVVFDLVDNTYHIAAASDSTTPITNPIGNQPYETEFGRGRAAELGTVALQSYALDGDNELGFGIYGQLDQTTNATVTLASGTKTITITIDAISGETSIGPVS